MYKIGDAVRVIHNGAIGAVIGVETLGIVEVDSTVWKKLSEDEKAHILSVCDKKLDEYYERIK